MHIGTKPMYTDGNVSSLAGIVMNKSEFGPDDDS